MKVSKEAIAGLRKALELFMAADHAAERRAHLAQAETLVDGLAGCATARCWIESEWDRWQAPVVRIAPVDDAWSPKSVQAALREGEPAIHIDTHGDRLQISTHCLQPGEEPIVAGRLRAIFTA